MAEGADLLQLKRRGVRGTALVGLHVVVQPMLGAIGGSRRPGEDVPVARAAGTLGALRLNLSSPLALLHNAARLRLELVQLPPRVGIHLAELHRSLFRRVLHRLHVTHVPIAELCGLRRARARAHRGSGPVWRPRTSSGAIGAGRMHFVRAAPAYPLRVTVPQGQARTSPVSLQRARPRGVAATDSPSAPAAPWLGPHGELHAWRAAASQRRRLHPSTNQ